MAMSKTERQRAYRARQKAVLKAARAAQVEVLILRRELAKAREQFAIQSSSSSVKAAPLVAHDGAPFMPSVQQHISAGELVPIVFGRDSFAIRFEHHAAASAAMIAYKERKVGREATIATLAALASA
jgi:hypothetical protein